MYFIVILLLLLVFPIMSLGQQGHGSHSGAEKRPVVLETGVGDVNHPVSTKNPEAQKFFNQGLAYLYAFNHDEGVRSFKRAAELDPELAMAYWGASLGLGANYNDPANPDRFKQAYEILQKAIALAPKASPVEQAYIKALSKRYSADPNADPKKLAADYRIAMSELVKQYPDDLDAATLYAESMMNLRPWQLWTLDGKPAEGTLEIVAVLEGVLRRNPNHTGANHYYIHAIEASKSPERGLASANRLGALAPSAGHLVHMPSHIYLRTGDYDDAVKSNDLAIVADRNYIQKSGAQGIYPAMYYNHNIHMLAASHARNGNFAGALKAAKDLETNVGPSLAAMPMLEMFMPYHLTTLVRFHKWDDVMKYPKPAPELKLTTAFWHLARGMALAETGKTADAENELVAMRAVTKTVAPDAMMFTNPSVNVLKVADELLTGEVALSMGDRVAGIEALRRAAAAEDLTNYAEPPDWDLPVREWLGRALMRSGDYAGAEKVYREEIARNARSGRALFGLAEALRRQGNTLSAQMVEREFENTWKSADTKMSAQDLYGTVAEKTVSAVPDRWRPNTIALKTGLKMNYVEQGDPAGPVILLLHGLTDSSYSYSLVMPLLDKKYRVYAVDNRGHGDSSRPETGYGMSDFAADLIAFMDAKNIRKATLVGHSMGSFVAMRAAADAPERFERLVLIGTGTTANNNVIRELRTQFRALKDPIPVEFATQFQSGTTSAPMPEGFLQKVVQQSLKAPVRVWNAALDGVMAEDLSKDFAKIKMPVLVIWGDKEQIFPRSEQDLLVSKLPNAKLKVIPGAGHSPNWEFPQVVADDITAFISTPAVKKAGAPK